MLTNRSQCYLLGLVLATTLSANIQSVNAQSVNYLEGSATSSTINSTFATLASNQYQANTPFIEPTQNVNPTAIFPNYDGELFQNTDSMSGALVGLTVSKYDKMPVGTNKVFMSNEMIASMTSQANTSDDVPNSHSLRRGTLVSNNYNAISMLRTMDDSQNIAYVGMNEINAEPRSDALNRELKITNYLAFVPENTCVNSENTKLPKTCQTKNAEKMVATMSMIQAKTWSAQMTKDFSFWQNMNVSLETASR
ncbi:hypothetical protein H6G80_31890 [Nostoc sp. FACHB-87]|uniref:hypothetical protein n=1 Tax=Nostocaceae TaxID=1162 RepID=UPI0016825894|nr:MULTISPECIES: hypothetical protein [Nostocaceae]MBD2458653.1 hypothetical protein [Nostoc sp. FACHB-87]MBD2479649.1 hypothetical protein [Anabaena sp. FACHB-83]